MKLSLYIKEQEINAVINSSSIRVQLNKDTNDPKATGTISTNTLELTIDGAKIVNQYRLDGESGGMGVFEGLPSRLEARQGSLFTNLIDGYLDLADGTTEFECDKTTIKIVQKGANQWFSKRKDSFSYAFLASLEPGTPGRITRADNISVPYVISTIPNVTELAIISVSIFVLGMQIRTVIKDLAEFIIEVAGVFTTAPAIIKLLAYIAFIIILFIAMIKLIQDLINLIIQPVKYMAGMRLRTLLERGSEYLGLEFESSKFDDPFWNDTILIPEKYQSFDDGTGVLGIKRPNSTIQNGFYNGTFGDVLGIANRLWNARELVGNGKIIVERTDKNTGSASYVLPALEILAHQLNTDEFKSNTSIRFGTDLAETNTIDQFEGTFTDIIVEPKAIENDDMVLMSGERRIETGVAQAKKKIDLTKPEQFMSNLVMAIGPLLDLLLRNAPKRIKRKIPTGGFANLFENRRGMMLVSTDFPQIPKVLSLDIAVDAVNTKIKDANATRMTSNGLYDESYFIDSFVPSAKLPKPNQWVKRTREDITFCLDDYFKVVNNPFIFDSQGRKGKLISLDWGAEDEEATIEYWIQEIYTRNLKETIITPPGI